MSTIVIPHASQCKVFRYHYWLPCNVLGLDGSWTLCEQRVVQLEFEGMKFQMLNRCQPIALNTYEAWDVINGEVVTLTLGFCI